MTTNLLPPPAKELMSQDAAAEYLGVSVETLAKWRSEGKGPPYYKPHSKLVLYHLGQIQDWMLDNWVHKKAEGKDANQEPARGVALQVLDSPPRVQRNNRLGRHGTKQERRRSEGGNQTPADPDGPTGAPSE